LLFFFCAVFEFLEDWRASLERVEDGHGELSPGGREDGGLWSKEVRLVG